MKMNSYIFCSNVFKLEIMHAADQKKLMNGFIFIQAHSEQPLKSTLGFVQMEPRAVLYIWSSISWVPMALKQFYTSINRH